MSMKDLHFAVDLQFDTPQHQESSEKLLLKCMALVAQINKVYLDDHPLEPNLYESGIVYTPPDQNDGRPPLRREDTQDLLALLKRMGAEPDTALMVIRILKGIEIFLDYPRLLKRGKGDCNELVPVRIAELWRAGILASPYLVKAGANGRGGISYHAVVLWPDGSSEDPSLILGMGGRERADERAEEIRKNMERFANFIDAGMSYDEAMSTGLVPHDGTFKSPYPKAA